MAVDAQGNLFIADSTNQRIRRVDGATGIITTVAGSWRAERDGSSPLRLQRRRGSGHQRPICRPWGVALDAYGNIFIADSGNFRIRRVDAASGIITTVAGNGVSGFSGDGGAATNAILLHLSA